MSESKIEWTERTWNPIVGCSILTPGCTNCYAMKMAARLELMGNVSHYAGTTKKVKGNAVWTGKLALAPDSILLEPLKRKKPTTYFVNSMGDLFHEDCPDEWIDKVFAVMALSPQHTYQILTKRAAPMRQYFDAGFSAMGSPKRMLVVEDLMWKLTAYKEGGPPDIVWPLPNIWLGVSTERQQEADERIPHLLQTPAAVRFISAEPLLGPIRLDDLNVGKDVQWNALGPRKGGEIGCLDWVIVGGESGLNARPMHPQWVRDLRQQCDDEEVAFFFKQWGEYHPSNAHDPKTCKQQTPDAIHVDGRREYQPSEQFRLIGGRVAGWAGMCRIGKKSAGRLLDGIEHNAMPSKVTACS